MSNLPLRKPRHADGRAMSEDEIRALDGEALQNMVGSCIMGCVWIDLGEYWGFVDSATANQYPKCERSTFKPNSTSCDVIKNTPWTTDIAAAFTVDRPEWRWGMADENPNSPCGVELWIPVPSEDSVIPHRGDVFVFEHQPAHEQDKARKLTPQDYARARCIAALLLAAKIGE